MLKVIRADPLGFRIIAKPLTEADYYPKVGMATRIPRWSTLQWFPSQWAFVGIIL